MKEGRDLGDKKANTNFASEILEDRSKAEKSGFPFGLESMSGLLQERLKDLQWLIEERAAQKDYPDLKKIVELFPAQELTSRLQLSEYSLRMIARIPEDSSQNSLLLQEQTTWLLQALDRAHWRRLEEERNPLMKLERLSDEQILSAFLSLPSIGEKAVMLSAISKGRWPSLLSRLKSDERIQLGLMLAQYQSAVPTDRRAMEAALIQRVSESLNETHSTQSMTDGVLEDFALCLPEKEGQVLLQELSTQPHLYQLTSVDSLLKKLEPAALLEVCMSLEVKTLQALLPSVSASTCSRIQEILPKSLRDRLFQGGSDASVNEALAMKARTDLMGAYRKIQARA